MTVLAAAAPAPEDFQLRYRTPPAADLYCGVDCLYVALRSAGTQGISLQHLQEVVSPGANGVSIDMLQRASRSQGIFATTLQLDPGVLAYCRSPMILHVNERHFVTFLGIEDGHILLFDSALGLFDCSREWFLTHYEWDGVSLVVGLPSPGLVAWILGPLWACVGLGAVLVYCAAKLPWRRWKVLRYGAWPVS